MINNRPLTIALVAGETSGDALGAGLIRALNTRISNVRFVGIAGPLMQAEGCEAWYEMEELAVMGIIEVCSRLYRLLRIRAELKRRFTILKPDVFIGIDAPDFNISLEKNLKKKGIKTVHYVSPSVWAWRQKRVLKISKSNHLVLVFFPFEKVFYEKFITCRFIGHSIADKIPLDPNKNAARDALNIPRDVHCLALLPGSRKSEVKMLSTNFLEAAKILSKSYPDLEIVVPLVNTKIYEQFKRIKSDIAPDLQVRLLNGKSQEAMIASDAALLASGTVSLECMLAKCPMVVGYRMNQLTFWIAKLLVKTSYISLPNLLYGRELVKEFLQKECKPSILAMALSPILKNKGINQETYTIFRNLHQQIRRDADNQAADAILELITK